MEEKKKKKMKLYVSLPISGRCLKDVKVYAKRVKFKWETKGYDVITPFDVVKEDGKPYSFCMGRDVEALMECDGIVLCPDWFSSRGCRLEYNVAEIYKLKVFVDDTKYMGRYEHGTDGEV